MSSVDLKFKVLVIGDSGVGKSSFLIRFCDNTFDGRQRATVGVDFRPKVINFKQKMIQLNIWDTYAYLHSFFLSHSAGQERFRTLTSSYYRGAHGAIVMYDATNRESFDNLSYWLEEIDHHANTPGLVKMLVGSKLDANPDLVKVSRSEGEIFAIEHSMLFHEISSKKGTGVAECVNELVDCILENPGLVRRGTPQQSSRIIESQTFSLSSCSSC